MKYNASMACIMYSRNHLRILCSNIRRYILIKKFKNQRDTVGKHQMLGDEFELINMVDFSVLQQQQDYSGNRLDYNFFMTSDVNSQLH